MPDFSWGGGGLPFMPTGMDAVSALLARMPGAFDTALAQKTRAREQEERAREQAIDTGELDYQSRQLALQEQRNAPRRAKADELRRRRDEDMRRWQERQDEAMRRQAYVSGSKQLHSTYGGPTGFNPDQAIADYYTRGPGGR